MVCLQRNWATLHTCSNSDSGIPSLSTNTSKVQSYLDFLDPQSRSHRCLCNVVHTTEIWFLWEVSEAQGGGGGLADNWEILVPMKIVNSHSDFPSSMKRAIKIKQHTYPHSLIIIYSNIKESNISAFRHSCHPKFRQLFARTYMIKCWQGIVIKSMTHSIKLNHTHHSSYMA